MSHDTQTISRAAALLRALADAGQPLRLVDLVKITGMHKATVHRLMRGLMTEGLVLQSDSRRYSLGPEALIIGNAASSQFDLVHIAQHELKSIAEVTQDVALMMVRTGQTAVCMAREEGTYPLKPSSLQVGSRRPLGVGAGSLAILSALDDETVDLILSQSEEALAEYPGYSVSKILEMIEEARRTGYAFVDGLIIPEMIAVAAPVFDSHGAPHRFDHLLRDQLALAGRAVGERLPTGACGRRPAQ